MAINKINKQQTSESGFSYIDVMIAIVILMVGVLGLLSAMTAGLMQASGQEQQMIAKQVAASTMESIMSVKESTKTNSGGVAEKNMGWEAVGNVGENLNDAGVAQGLFVAGENQVMEQPGPDNIVGTADDDGHPVNGVVRQIIIQDECDPDRPSPNCAVPGTAPVRIRSVQVIVGYFVGNIRRQEVLTTLLSDYAPAEVE